MKNALYTFGLLFLMIIAFSCSKKEEGTPKGVGIDLVNIDSTVKPGDDFFQFVNGGWLKTHEIPGDLGSYGSFLELHEETQRTLLNIMEKAGKSGKYEPGSDPMKAIDFYFVGMDSTLAEQNGVKVLKPYFDEIESIRTKADLQSYLERDLLRGGTAFFGLQVEPDLNKSTHNTVYVVPNGLGLPERDYYLKTDEKSKETRAKYVEYLKNLFVLSGDAEDAAQKSAEAVLALETDLAREMMTKEQSRDPYNYYNPIPVSDLSKLLPSIDWKDYFSSLGITADTVVVADKGFVRACERAFNKSLQGDVKTYLRASLLRSAAAFLNHDFVKASFEFNSKYMRGIEQLRPRWKRVLAMTNNMMGEAIGQLYVDEKFPPEAKEKAVEMVENIKIAFGERIKQLEWMSDSTKEMALKKLSTFKVKIGYPEKWTDYSSLEVNKDLESASYFQNVVNASMFEAKRELAKVGKPVDRHEWEMSPQTVNAYYNPPMNEIVFPAAILQPPFYDYRADEAVNYGGIGAVIGHEISHGFDDQGSKFDAEGNLKNWFTKEDLEAFRSRGKLLADQFSKYEVLPGVFVQGEFTLGENIGDLGGITAAYDGLQLHFKKHGRPDPIDGFTPEQRFFMSWATVWRGKYRDEALRTQVLTDPHSPVMLRANGPLSNFTPFYEAFDVKEGDKMYRPDSLRVKIW